MNKRTLQAIWQTLMLAQDDYGGTKEKWAGMGAELVHVATVALAHVIREEENTATAEIKPMTEKVQ